MGNRTATGRSRATSTRAAVTECAESAMRALGRAPTFGFMFASPRHDMRVALTLAESAVGAPLLASTTAGEFTDAGHSSGGMVIMLMATDESWRIESAAAVRGNVDAASAKLCASFADLVREGGRRGNSASTSVVLVDGLSGDGEAVIEGVRRHTRPFQQVVGGAAGDDAQFRETLVGTRGAVNSHGAVALHVIGERPWGVGLGTGLKPATPRMTATRAKANVLFEIDRKPAFEAYRAYARELGVQLEPETAGTFMIEHEIGVYFLDELRYARAPLRVQSDGSLACAASVPEGASVCFLSADPPTMVSATRSAALEAKSNLQGPAAGVIVFDCICRASLLGKGFDAEIDAVRAVFPEAPICGFMTYGEIARYKGKLQGWHNTTAVVVAIPA